MEENFFRYIRNICPPDKICIKSKTNPILTSQKEFILDKETGQGSKMILYFKILHIYLFVDKLFSWWWWLCRCWDTAMYPLCQDGCSIIVDILHHPSYTSSLQWIFMQNIIVDILHQWIFPEYNKSLFYQDNIVDILHQPCFPWVFSFCIESYCSNITPMNILGIHRINPLEYYCRYIVDILHQPCYTSPLQWLLS